MFDKFFHLIDTKQKQIVITFFTLFLVLSVIILKDYGLNWDEEMQWKSNGEVVAMYITDPSETKEILLNSKEKYHGPAFEVLLIAVEKIFQLEDTRDVYLMRHFVTFLTFYIGVIFFYFLCKRSFKNWKLALIGCIFLVLSPRIFADSFYNSKDLPFLSFFIIGMYTLLLFHEQPTYKNAIQYAIVCAFTIDIRILGILLPAISFLFFGTDMLYSYLYARKERIYIKPFILFIACLIICVIAFWPVLWEGPIHHFLKAFEEMRKFSWDESVLYRGNYIKATQLPWHYLPVWILITTPIPYLGLFVIGILFILYMCWKAPLNFIFYKKEQQLVLICSVFPIAVIIFLKSVVYDGWRHVFFIYPAFIMIALYGLVVLHKWVKKNKIIISSSLILIAGFMLITMVKLHPHEYVYFNAFAGKDMKEVKAKFELDYYGVSSKEALDYILKKDSSYIIKICPTLFPQSLNVQLLLPEERCRIRLVDYKDATYLIGQPRFGRKKYNFDNEIFSVMVGNASIISVFELTAADRRKANNL